MYSRSLRMLPLTDVRVCLNIWLGKIWSLWTEEHLPHHTVIILQESLFPSDKVLQDMLIFYSQSLEVPGAFPSTVCWLLNSEWHSLWPGRQVSSSHLVTRANTEQGVWAGSMGRTLLGEKGLEYSWNWSSLKRHREGPIKALKMWYYKKWFLPIFDHRCLSFCVSRDDFVLITNACHEAQWSHDAASQQ